MGVLPEVKVKVVLLVLQRSTALQLDDLEGRNQEAKERWRRCSGGGGDGAVVWVVMEVMMW